MMTSDPPPKPALHANLMEQLRQQGIAPPIATTPSISITVAAGGTLNLTLSGAAKSPKSRPRRRLRAQ